VTRDDRESAAAEINAGALGRVEAQPVLTALAVLLVGSVAAEALLRKDWPNLAVEIRRARPAHERGDEGGQQAGEG
jgi:hypothetical protein